MCPHGLEIREVGRQRALHSLPEDAQPRGHTEVFTVGHTSGLGWYALQIYRMTNSAGATPTAEGTPVFWNKACTTAEPAAHCDGMSASLQSAVARQLGRSTHVREVRKVDPVAIMPARPTCARPRAGWAWMQHEFRPVAIWSAWALHPPGGSSSAGWLFIRSLPQGANFHTFVLPLLPSHSSSTSAPEFSKIASSFSPSVIASGIKWMSR